VPNRWGSRGGSDYDNRGHQFSRDTYSGGWHAHNLNGLTGSGNAQLSHTGGNQPFDIRPLYTVVQYIIYIKN
jgi:hypothetical protein